MAVRDRIDNLVVRNLVVTDSASVGGQPVTPAPATPASPAGDGSKLTGLDASALAKGTVPAARLGSGTGSASTYLRGDGTWSPLPAPPAPPAGGRVTVTGSATIATGLTSITSAVACLGQDATLGALRASCTFAGGSITIKVTKAASGVDGTPNPSTVPTVVNWIALGS